MNLLKNKFICPACMGNGYRKVFKDQASNLRVVIDCKACDNQGELPNDEKTKFSLRYLSNYISGLWPKENG